MWDQILRNDLNYIVLKADDAQLKNNYSKAIHFLLLAKQVSADKNIDYKLAEAYENLRNYPEADSVYRRVTYALPALLYPHYRLVKLYHKTRQLDKLQKEIHIIRKLRVKISSKDTDKMMKEIELLY